MIARLYHLDSQKAKNRAQELLEIFELTDAANRKAKTYSGGMRRRLDLAAALIVNPPVLFLDETHYGFGSSQQVKPLGCDQRTGQEVQYCLFNYTISGGSR